MASSTPRALVMTWSTFCTETLLSAIQALVSVTKVAKARAPLIRPCTGWCSSGTPPNELTIASTSPVARPVKYGIGPGWSRRCLSPSCSSAGAENSSGTQGIDQASHIEPDAPPRRSAAAAAGSVGLDHRRFELLERQGGDVERRGRLGPSAQALQHDRGVSPPQLRLERVGEIDDRAEHDLHDADIGRLEVGA